VISDWANPEQQKWRENKMSKYFTNACIALALIAISSTSALAQSIAINNGRIVTNGDSGILENTNLLIENGRVTTISGDAPFAGDTVLDDSDYWVTPGIFAPYSNIGLVEVSAESRSNDTKADTIDATVRIRAADSFNPKASNVAVSRAGGITTAAVYSGADTDIFGGIGMLVSTTGEFDSVLDEDAFFYVDYSKSSKKSGGTKGAAMAYLRSALDDARNYSTRFKSPDDGDTLRRADARALRPALQGRMPLIIKADRAVDMLNIIKLKGANPGLNITIIGAAEAWMITDQLVDAGVGVMVDPMKNLPSDFDQLGARLDNIQILKTAGVDTAIMAVSKTGSMAHNLRLLTQHAGNAVANGLSWDDAFKSISSVPAEMFGRTELGQILVGQTANLVVWDGDPLEAMSAPVAVIIDGELQSLKTRQSELRDRYNPTRSDDVPYGYPTP
jgi:imidazolonepropionase-like amidohydrolase